MKKQKKTDTVIFFFVPIAILLLWQILWDGGAISGAVMPVPTRIAAEMLAATKGVGYMIEYARELSQPEKLFVGLLSIGVIGLVTDAVILAVQKRLIVWN